MKHRIVFALVVTLLIAAPALTAGSSSCEEAAALRLGMNPDIMIQDPDGNLVPGFHCATVDFGPVENPRAPQDLDAWVREDRALELVAVSVPVAVHVLYYTKGKTVIGSVTDAQIIDLINVMNDAYAGTGLSFYLLSIDRTDNRDWATMRPLSPAEEECKLALAIDPANTLNLYTGYPARAIGWAHFPWSYPESSHMHGIVVRHYLLPGFSDYRDGAAVVHEGGHYFGLFHTFMDGCREPNDYCDDTPQEAVELKTACVEEDSCPDDPGMDPIYNYMNYTPDACRNEFTGDQITRMEWAITTYKPSLLD